MADRNARFAFDRKAPADFRRRNGIRELSVFGPALRGDFNPEYGMEIQLPSMMGVKHHSMSISGNNAAIVAHMTDACKIVLGCLQNFTKDYTGGHSEIPRAFIAGIRHRIIHDYGQVNLEIVRNTVTTAGITAQLSALKLLQPYHGPPRLHGAGVLHHTGAGGPGLAGGAGGI